MSKITKSSTAEYFAKNLQQVGFSSPLKAVLTTLKEAVDNSLDACEQHSILPELDVEVVKIGIGSTKNTDLVKIVVEDNGPGIEADDLGTYVLKVEARSRLKNIPPVARELLFTVEAARPAPAR